MMKKKFIFFILVVSLVMLLFTSGVSTWVIITEKNTDGEINDYIPITVDTLQTNTYNGLAQPIEYDVIDEYSNDISITYENETLEPTSEAPVNADLYLVKVLYQDEKVLEFNYKINPKPINIYIDKTDITYGDNPNNIPFDIVSFNESDLCLNKDNVRDSIGSVTGWQFSTYSQFGVPGSYENEIIPVGLSNSNYEFNYISIDENQTSNGYGKLEVKELEISHTWTGDSVIDNKIIHIFDNQPYKPTVLFDESGYARNEDINTINYDVNMSGNLTGNEAINVGLYEASITDNDNRYKLDQSNTCQVEIKPRQLTANWATTDFRYGSSVNVLASLENTCGEVLTPSILYRASGSSEWTSEIPQLPGLYKAKVDKVLVGGVETSNYLVPTDIFEFEIKPMLITKPLANNTVFIYNTFAQTYTLADSDYYTLSNNVRTNAGSQDVVVSLIDKELYSWSDGTNNDLTFTFTINKANPTIPSINEIEAIVGQSVSSLTLPSGFSWKTPTDTVKLMSNNYAATYTPDDTLNYNSADTLVSVGGYAHLNLSMDGGTFDNHKKTKYTGNNINLLSVEGIGTYSDYVTVTYIFADTYYSADDSNWMGLGKDVYPKLAGIYNVGVIVTSNSTYVIIDGQNSFSGFFEIEKYYVTAVLQSSEYEYDGSSKQASLELSGEVDSQSDFTIKYNNNTVSSVTDAYTYNVTLGYDTNKYELTSDSVTSCTLIINKKVIKLSGTVNLDYNVSVRTWAQVKSKIMSNTKFVDSDGNQVTLLTTAFNIKTMNNGIYYYGNQVTGLTTTTNVVGSTYSATFELLNVNSYGESNYMLEGTTSLVKYKTALVNGKYYTIEDAINNTSGTISFAGNSSGSATYVHTSFSALKDSNNHYIYSSVYNLSERKLYIPYADNKTSDYETSLEIFEGNVYSSLEIPSHITLNIYNNGSLTIGSLLSYKWNDTGVTQTARACNRGVLINNGTINIGTLNSTSDHSTLKSYGYIKTNNSNAIINLESGTKAVESFSIYDYAGGKASSSMYTNVLPMTAWSLHNNACKTKIKSGATYSGFVNFNMKILTTIEASTEFVVISDGKTENQNCLFSPDNDSNAYIIKNMDSTSYNGSYLTTITGSNQLAGQKEVLEVYGNYKDGVLNIDMSISIYDVNMQTSTSITLPISYMDIYIKDNSNLSISKTDYLLECGTKLVIEQGGSATVGDNVDIVAQTVESMNDITCSDGSNGDLPFKKFCHNQVDAYIENNGELIVTGNIGGKITSKSTNAILNISGNASAQYIAKKATVEPYYKVHAGNIAYGNIANAEGSSTLFTYQAFSGKDAEGNSSVYISKQSGTDYYFEKIDNSKLHRFEIEYVTNGGDNLSNRVVNTLEEELQVTNSQLPTPTRAHYSFKGWYLDEALTTEFVSTTLSSTNNAIKLYAKWEIITYKLNYDVTFEDGANHEYSIEQNTLAFNCNTSKITVLAPTCEGYVFDGWYIEVLGERIMLGSGEFTFAQLASKMPSGITEFNLFGEFVVRYTVKYQYADGTQIGETYLAGLNEKITLKSQDDVFRPEVKTSTNIIRYTFQSMTIDGVVVTPESTYEVTKDTVIIVNNTESYFVEVTIVLGTGNGASTAVYNNETIISAKGGSATIVVAQGTAITITGKKGFGTSVSASATNGNPTITASRLSSSYTLKWTATNHNTITLS